MTATENLRKLLDERGIEWEDHMERRTTWFTANGGGRVMAFETNAGYIKLDVGGLTPEQAVAATFGETCTMDRWLAEDVLEHECREYLMRCDSCGHCFCYVLSNEDGGTWTDEPPKYCPECGRKVVEYHESD